MKCYITIDYYVEEDKNVIPPIAIVEIDTNIIHGELITKLVDKALNKLKDKHPGKTIHMTGYEYLGHQLEIIKENI